MIVVCVVLYEPLICELNQLWRRLCFLVLHCCERASLGEFSGFALEPSWLGGGGIRSDCSVWPRYPPRKLHPGEWNREGIEDFSKPSRNHNSTAALKRGSIVMTVGVDDIPERLYPRPILLRPSLPRLDSVPG